MINVSLVTYLTSLEDITNAARTCSRSPIVDRIFVIDNSPSDSLRKSVSGIDKLVYIHNPSNPGYGAAHNIAIRKSISDGLEYHLVLNADVIFDFVVLESMLHYMKLDTSVGLLAPKMLYENGAVQCSRKLLPSPLNMFLRAFLPRKYRLRIDSSFELKQFDSNKSILVPYVSGAFMFLNTSVLSRVGLFDERFFMYPEDIDLSRRIAHVAKVRFSPQFTIIHKYGGATRKSIKMFVIHAFNMCLYFNKWGWVFDNNRSILNQKTFDQSF